MHPSDWDYTLPKELIAQHPLVRRDSSRLLVVDRSDGSLKDKTFFEIADHIPKGDVLVLNDTKVFPARLIGKKKKTEGKVDILLLSPYVKSVSGGPDEYLSAAEADELSTKKIWRCLIQPALKEGQEVVLAHGAEAVFMKRDADGTPLVEFKNAGDVKDLAREIGKVPLPPYIKREAVHTDKDTYQTVFAENEGAVAAPTAGLHFTKELLNKISQKGVEIVTLTLHVGYGTFKPVEDLNNHKIHSETFELSSESADKINRVRANRGKVWAVGTTTLRVLETCVKEGRLIAGKGETDLFIKEPFEFEAVDHLLTNFHLPKTTLLLLVSVFTGEALRKKAYQHAIDAKYRFYSYGDAMLIL